MRKAYQTDLSDAEWSCLETHLPAPKATGPPKMHTTREILNAIFYVVRGGCAWRLLPNDFPPWKTVYHYFRSWRLDGTWERRHSALRKRRVRVRLKRNPQPSAGIVDSQSIKTTGVGGKERGYDGAKKVKGGKRHLLVDTQGLLLEVRVHNANITDRDGIKLLLRMHPRPIASRAFLSCGWTLDTPARTRAPVGWRGRWDGRSRSCVTRPSRDCVGWSILVPRRHDARREVVLFGRKGRVPRVTGGAVLWPKGQGPSHL